MKRRFEIISKTTSTREKANRSFSIRLHITPESFMSLFSDVGGALLIETSLGIPKFKKGKTK